MRNVINRKAFTILLALAMFLTCTPALSYALTEDLEDRDKAVEESVEDIAAQEIEIEESECQIEEAETYVNEEALPEEKAETIIATEKESDLQNHYAEIKALLHGLEPSESKANLNQIEGSERKEALADNRNANGFKAEDIRIFGDNRYDTAIEVAEEYKDSSGKFENVIVAYGRNFPDALSGGYLAKVKNAPILLVEPSVEDQIVDYISDNILHEGTVYILGGTGVVSKSFENSVKAERIHTRRLGGNDRYDTNLKILKEAEVKAEDILVCTGNGFADSLSAAAVGKPILLVGAALTEKQKNYLEGLSTKQIYLIGGTGAVVPAVESGLKVLSFKPKRLGGQSRYETSTAVAGEFFTRATTVVLAYAQNFPDGLSGGPLAMMKNAPIILTESGNTAAARAYVKSTEPIRSYTLGGPALISYAAVKKIMGRTNPYINVEPESVGIQIGETAVITAVSNYGDYTGFNIRNRDLIEVVSQDILYNEKGEQIDSVTIRGRESGTAIIEFYNDYSSFVTKQVTINIEETPPDPAYIIIEPESVDIQIGETAVITAVSNYGDYTGFNIRNRDLIEIVSRDTSKNEKGEQVDNVTIRGRESGTAIIEFYNDYSDFVTKQVTINIEEMPPDPAYINVEPNFVDIQIGETNVIKIESNYGIEYTIENSDIITVVSRDTSENEKDVLTDTFTIRGKRAGRTVIKFKDKYNGLVKKSVVINVGEMSIQNVHDLHDIIEMTGYENWNKDKTAEPSVDDEDTKVYFVNHSDSVELVSAVLKSDVNTYTSMIIPLNGSTSYLTRIIIESNGSNTNLYTDIYPDEYTNSTIINGNEAVNSAFRTSMATWNSVLEDNYGMKMKNLGFTQY